MRRFQFRLQRLLELARQAENQLRRKAAAALSDLKDAEEALRVSIDIHAAAQREIAAKLAMPTLDARLIRRHQDYADAVLMQTRRQRERVKAAETVYEAAQQELVRKRRDVMTLERSREQAFEEWRLERERRDGEATDEAAAARWLEQPRA